MKLKIDICNSKGKVLESEEFDGRGFYESTFVYFASLLNLIDIDKKVFMNTKEGLEERLNLKVDDKIKKELLLRSELGQTNVMVLKIASHDNCKIEDIQKFRDTIKPKTYGNLEDITEFLERNDRALRKASYLEFTKIKD